MATEMTNFYGLLKDLYTRAGRPTTAALAEQTGLSTATVHTVLTGRSLGRWDTVNRIIDALGGNLNDVAYYEAWVANGGGQGRIAVGRDVPSDKRAETFEQKTAARIADALERIANALEEANR